MNGNWFLLTVALWVAAFLSGMLADAVDDFWTAALVWVLAACISLAAGVSLGKALESNDA